MPLFYILVGLALVAGCTGSDADTDLSSREPADPTIQPLGVVHVEGSPPDNFSVAFSNRQATAMLDYVWAASVAGRNRVPDNIALLDAVEQVDYTTSALVATTADGCGLGNVWLEPLTNALVRHSYYNDPTMGCDVPVFSTYFFAVPLRGMGADGDFDYGPAAVPAVVDSDRDTSGFSLTAAVGDATSERFRISDSAINAESLVPLSTIDWRQETTQFLLDAEAIEQISERNVDSGWITADRLLSRLDLEANYAVVLVFDACFPEHVWVEYAEPVLRINVGERLVACDSEDPYAALFVLPRSWQTEADQSPAISIQKVDPN